MTKNEQFIKEVETTLLLASVVRRRGVGGNTTIGFSVREKEPEHNEFGASAILDLPELTVKLATEVIDIVDADNASTEFPDLYNMLHMLLERF